MRDTKSWRGTWDYTAEDNHIAINIQDAISYDFNVLYNFCINAGNFSILVLNGARKNGYVEPTDKYVSRIVYVFL